MDQLDYILEEDQFTGIVNLLRNRKFDIVIDKMLKVYNKAITKNDIVLINKASTYLLEAYYAIGDLRLAFKYGKNLLLSQKTKLNKMDANVYLFMAIIHYELKEYEKVLYYCHLIISLEEGLNLFINIQTYLNLIRVYTELERYDEAYSYLEKLEESIEHLTEPTEIIEFYYNIVASILESKNGRTSEALEYLQKANGLSLFRDNPSEKLFYYEAASKYWSALGNQERQMSILIKGFQMSCRYNNIGFRRKFLSEIYINRALLKEAKLRIFYSEAYVESMEEFYKLASDINAFSFSTLIEKKGMYEEIYTDFVTGIKNRAYIKVYLEEHSNYKNLSCIMFDIDNFKSVNDTYGHLTGDKALKCLAVVSQEVFADWGVVARYGGDEFIVIVLNRDVEQVKLKAQKLIRKVEKRSFEACGKCITISLGLSNSAVDFLEKADQQMYKAKRLGKNQMCCEIE